MGERKFNDWLAGLPALAAAQKQRLEIAFAGADPATSVARELDAMGVSECPHCAAGSPVRNGRASDLQRYKCYACRRTFNVLTDTPLSRLRHRSAWRVVCPSGDPRRDGARLGRAGVHKALRFAGAIGFCPRLRLCRHTVSGQTKALFRRGYPLAKLTPLVFIPGVFSHVLSITPEALARAMA